MKITEFKIGDSARITRQITSDYVKKFAEMTGDDNPVHLDEEYAKNTIFNGRIVHGILVSGLISGVLGNKFPGYGTIYLSQSLKFLKPVRVDDIITAEVEVIDINIEKNRLTLKTRCYNDKDIDVIVGEAIVLPPK
ncbi:MaoC family dehydratase [Clostridium sp. UBA1056]|uniref:MaoC family dehydratase n=1 Tax=Clostridium sp. UBA1056 TaxID=1946346 RepID=UPI003216A4C1